MREFADLQRSAAEEILLLQAEKLALLGGIPRIQHGTDLAEVNN